jgi:hypothetical protein
MTIDDILALPNEQFDDKANWEHLDQLIGSLSDAQAQINAWNRILRHTETIKCEIARCGLLGRGRDDHRWSPPAQIRTSAL